MLDLRHPDLQTDFFLRTLWKKRSESSVGKTGQSRSIEKIFITVDGMPLLVYSNTKEVRKKKRRTGTCTRDCPLFCIRACRMGGDEDEIKNQADLCVYDRDDSAYIVYNCSDDGICAKSGK